VDQLLPLRQPSQDDSDKDDVEVLEEAEMKKLVAWVGPPPDQLALLVDLTRTNVPPPAEEAAAPPPKKDHPLLAMLKSNKKGVGGISKQGQGKKGVQWQHLENLVSLGTDIFHPSIAKEARTKQILTELKEQKGPKTWTKPIIATGLYDIHGLLEASRQKEEETRQVAVCPGKKQQKKKEVNSHVKAFNAYIVSIQKMVEVETQAANKKKAAAGNKKTRKPSKIGNQKGRILQESYTYNPDHADKHTCPKCFHNLVMVAETVEDRVEYKQAMKEYNAKMAVYERLTADEKKEMRKPSLPSQWKKGLTLICMCSRSNCNNTQSGVGCYNCKVGFDKGDRPELKTNPQNQYLECQCATCNCTCTAMFGSNQRAKFGVQCADERAAEMEKQQNVPVAVGPNGEFY